MFLQKLVVGPLASNCYLVGPDSGGSGMIIDPADEAGRILQGARKAGLDIEFIVLTHGHPDHIGAVKEVTDATGARLAVHTDDAPFLQQEALALALGFSYPPPPAPDRLLAEGDRIEVGDLRFTVIHTPGHSPGGICLLEHGVLFSGDTLFNYGIGRYDLPGGDYDRLMDSIHNRLMALPDDTVVYPGHGPETTIGRERRSNPFLHG